MNLYDLQPGAFDGAPEYKLLTGASFILILDMIWIQDKLNFTSSNPKPPRTLSLPRRCASRDLPTPVIKTAPNRNSNSANFPRKSAQLTANRRLAHASEFEVSRSVRLRRNADEQSGGLPRRNNPGARISTWNYGWILNKRRIG